DGYGAPIDGPAVFSADGTRMVFTRTTPLSSEGGSRTGGMREIYVANADGTDATRLTFDQANDKQSPTWSPDGSTIAFSYGSTQALTVMNADGTGQHALGPVNANRPSYSPDGSTIVFYAYTGTNNDIFTIPAGGGGTTAL